jgi:hypothetical protein
MTQQHQKRSLIFFLKRTCKIRQIFFTLGSSRETHYRIEDFEKNCYEICSVTNCGEILLLMLVTLETLKNWEGKNTAAPHVLRPAVWDKNLLEIIKSQREQGVCHIVAFAIYNKKVS